MAQDFVNAVLALSPVAFWPAIGADASGHSRSSWVNGNANNCATQTPGLLFDDKNATENTALTTNSATSTYRKYACNGEIDFFADLAAGPVTLLGIMSSSVATGWSPLLGISARGTTNVSELYIFRNYGNDPRYIAVLIYDSAGHATIKVFSDTAAGIGPWRTGEKVIWHLRIDAGFVGNGSKDKIHFGFDGVDLAEAAGGASAANGSFSTNNSNARWLLGAYTFSTSVDTLAGGSILHQGLAYFAGVSLTDSQLEDVIAGACYSVGGVGVGLNGHGHYDPALDVDFVDRDEAAKMNEISGAGPNLASVHGDKPLYLVDPLGRKCYDFRSVSQNSGGRQTSMQASGLTIRPWRFFQFAVASLTSHACDTSYEQGRFFTSQVPYYASGGDNNNRNCGMAVGRANVTLWNISPKTHATSSMARGIPSLSVFGTTIGGDGNIYGSTPRFIMDNGDVVAGSGACTNGVVAVHTEICIGAIPVYGAGPAYSSLTQDSFCGRLYFGLWGSRPLSDTAMARLRDYLVSTFGIANQTRRVTVWGTSIECAHLIDEGDGHAYSNAGWVQDFAPARLLSSLDLVNCATGNASLATIANLDPSLDQWYASINGATPADPIVIIEPFTNNIYAGTSVNDQMTAYAGPTGIHAKILQACPNARIVLVFPPLDDNANGHGAAGDHILGDLHDALVADTTLYERLVVIPSGRLTAWVHPSTLADSRVIADAVWGEVADMLAGSPVKFLLLLD